MNKILIANRGEIALRVMKTVKAMGIKTVAVFSEVDRNSPHVQFADEAVLIGESPSNKSYLDGSKIIKFAKELNVEGIHPGYGFLSENADFAEEVEANDIIFIGPGPKAITTMGSKLAAKEAVKSYNIPMVPGTENAISDVSKAIEVAKNIGFPILIKASAGGGGKGMRIVNDESELESQMERAISEAKSAFGDGSVFIEKYIGSPRHIEIQVVADNHGNVIHLMERECSIQRRHQKVVEEAPSVVLEKDLRMAMGKAAVDVALACEYRGVGTVEFLLDEYKDFYFLEMNTRLQVEHPVTELITGIDLVKLQIEIARGQKLAYRQEDININGHAIELRVYAEDPKNDFLPSIGTLTRYTPPTGKGIRVDDGYEEGMDIPIFYDPMLAKLIVHAANRKDAIYLMLKAIRNYEVEGVETTLEFGEYVMKHPAFVSGDYNTHFVKDHFSVEALKENDKEMAEVAAVVALYRYLEDREVLRLPKNAE